MSCLDSFQIATPSPPRDFEISFLQGPRSACRKVSSSIPLGVCLEDRPPSLGLVVSSGYTFYVSYMYMYTDKGWYSILKAWVLNAGVYKEEAGTRVETIRVEDSFRVCGQLGFERQVPRVVLVSSFSSSGGEVRS
jgi:hypothetical protein